MSASNDYYQRAMSQGHSAAWDLDWTSAAGFYRQALEESPNDPHALLSLGLALFEMQDLQAALQTYLQAAQLSPEDPIPVEKVARICEMMDEGAQAAEAAMRAADLYLKKGDVEKAIENWSFITHLDPQHVMAHSRLALAHERKGRKAQAVTEYLAVVSLLQHAGKSEEAQQVASRALQLAPGDGKVRQAVEMLQSGQPLPMPTRPVTKTGPLAEAANVLRLEEPKQLSRVDSNLDPVQEAHKAAMAELANLLFELSEEQEEQPPAPRRGIHEITRGEGAERESTERAGLVYRLRQAIDLQTTERDEEAAVELEEVFELGLELPAIHFNLGYLYARTERLESSLRHLQRALNHEAYALGGRLLLGQLLRERGQLKNAAVQYLEALREADSSVVSPEMADQVHQMYEPLIEAHLQGAEDDDHAQLCDNIEELLARPNWRAHLEHARRELPTPGPDAPPAPLAEVLTQASSGQIVEALTAIHQHARSGFLRVAMDEAYRALDYAPAYLPLHSLMGDLLVKQERVDSAIQKFKTVAKAYSSRGESVRARELYQRILQLAPMDLDTRQMMIDQLVVSGEIEAALQQYMEMSDVYIRLAELETARETFSRAFNLVQQTNAGRVWGVKILHDIADLDLQRLDWRQALKVYERIGKIDPADEKARTKLIDLHLRMGQEKQAMTEIDSFISYLVGQSQQEKAFMALEELTIVHAANLSINQRLAEMYQQAGRKEQAVEQWDRVGELALEAGDNEQAIQALRAIITLQPPNVTDYQRLLADLEG